jgi:O-antigen ligase
MTPPTADSSPRMRRIAAVLLTLLLLLLVFRLTAPETLRETLNQKRVVVERALSPKATADAIIIPTVGPPFITVYTFLTFALAGAASFLAARVGALSLRRVAQGAFIALIVALALGSTFLAANRFNALVGTADFAVALAAAWTVTLLCDDRLLGIRGRQVVIAAMVAACFLGCAKAFLQEFDEFPATRQEVMKNFDAAMRSQGLDPTDHAQHDLFLGRLNSGEVAGYFALPNVFATLMVGAIGLLAGLIIAGLAMPAPASAPAEPQKRPGTPLADSGSGQIPLRILALIFLPLILLAAGAALKFTDSNGGMMASGIAVAAIILGILLRRQLAAYRRVVTVTATLAVVAVSAAVLTWGFTHDGLPSRSLLFRWQYWTGAAPMIESHPFAGVGFHNFGDYYGRFKLPNSPEDVKDPHNFFVRLASEAGIPLAIAVLALIIWMLQGAWGSKAAAPQPDSGSVAPVSPRRRKAEFATGRSSTPAIRLSPFHSGLIVAAGVAVAWVPLHFLAEKGTEYAVIITAFFAFGAWFVFAAVMALLDSLEPAATRMVVFAGVIAAMGMLLYDQINMALVTGPVAMLFWMMVGLGESMHVSKPANTASSSSIAMSLWGFAGVVSAVLLCTLAYGMSAWDPAPYEYAYIRHDSNGPLVQVPVAGNGTMAYRHKIPIEEALRAFESLKDAIKRTPNSIELRLALISLLRDTLHKPVADEIRSAAALDHANASLRVMLASPDSDLPASERILMLEQALELDKQLSPEEPKRLQPEKIRQIQDTIARLKKS